MRSSIYDEFKETIQYYREKGYNLKEISRMLPEGYTYDGLNYYVHNRDFLSKPKSEITCDRCGYMMEVETYVGCKQRLCLRSRKMITPSLKVAPRWCKERICG